MNFNKKLLLAFAILLNITYICAKAHSECGKDHVPVPGGQSPICDSKSLGTVEDHAKYAVSQLTGCTYKHIEEPTAQVVTGVIYRANVQHDCGGKEKKCSLKILSQPFVGPYKLSWECDEYKNLKLEDRVDSRRRI